MEKLRFFKNWSRTSLHSRFSVLFFWTRKLLFSARKHQIYEFRKKWLALNVLNKLACSRRSDSRAQDKNSRRKKNEGKLEGERGRELSLSRSREETFHVVVKKCTKKRDARANLLFQPIAVLTSV